MSLLFAASDITPTGMVDSYGRTVSYLRLSVTDRCDLRCTYCMAEKMQFLPKAKLLTLEELDVIASEFITKGVRKLRITGGEPLVRKGMIGLIESLSRHLKSGLLDELTLTTNGTQLARFVGRLAAAGVKRINVSIDSLIPETYAKITRGGDLDKLLFGLKAAQAAGLDIKLNCVALKHDNVDEIPAMIKWAHSQGMDFTLIEAMPMGEISEDRFDQYVAVSDIKQKFDAELGLQAEAYQTGGPAQYFRAAKTGGRVGFITPLSHKFCNSCNRVRLTCTGKLYLCLGQNDSADLRTVLREQGAAALSSAIDGAIGRKPKDHDFSISGPGQAPAVPRHMSLTGG